MNNVKMIVLAISVLFVSSASSVCPTTGPVIALAGAAPQQFEMLRTSFNDVFVPTVKQAITFSFNNIKNTYSDQGAMLVQAVIEANQMQTNNKLETIRASSELLATHKASLLEYKKKMEHELIPLDGVNGGPSEQYFAKLCANEKLTKGVFGTEQIKSSSKKRTKTLGEFDKKSDRVVSANKFAREQQTRHYEKYCSQQGVRRGDCVKESDIPNADVLAFVALNPSNEEGKGVLKDAAMKTLYTYSNFEQGAATDFFNNIMSSGALKKPKIHGSDTPPNVVARYNQLKGALSLAKYSFTVAEMNRQSQSDGEIRLSRFDKIRYMINKSETEDLQNSTSATIKGRYLYVLNQQAIGKMMKKEKAAYQERINNLLGALIAVRESKPSIVDELNSFR